MNVHSFLLNESEGININKIMAQTEQNTDKRTALLEATLALVCNHGFHNTPMAKIAKMAGVSAGTIYLYFDNKQDLIDSLYLEVKSSFTRASFEDYNKNMTIKQGFKKVWKNMAAYKMSHVKEALFLAQCDNSPIISEEVREKGLEHLQPLLELWERGREQNVIRAISPYVLYAFAIYPISFFAAAEDRGEYKLPEKDHQPSFEMAWRAIKAE